MSRTSLTPYPYYRDVLGITVKLHDGDWAELDTGGTKLALHADSKLEAKNKERTSSAHIFR
jgi:hypothetical protein